MDPKTTNFLSARSHRLDQDSGSGLDSAFVNIQDTVSADVGSYPSPCPDPEARFSNQLQHSQKTLDQNACCSSTVSGQHDEASGESFEFGYIPGEPLKRKWKYFPGNNRFYCGGRIMTAPKIRYCSFSLAFILLAFGLFIVFDAPFLTRRLTVAIPILSSLLFIIVIANMLRTSCSDPGILPRATLGEIEYMEKSYGNIAGGTYRPVPRNKDILVNGQIVKIKYCFTCKMFRPPRVSHCGICDNCVDRFDHHCPFLGNCVGRRNYRSFYFFVVSLSLLAVLILSCSITHLALLAKDTGDFLEALRESPTSTVVILISFIGMWTVIGLAGFHTYLIAVEQTTNEDIKGHFGRPNAKNPYSRGNACSNCCFILCGPSSPSLLDPRGFATPEYLSSLQTVKVSQQAAPTVYQQPVSVSTTPKPTPNLASPASQSQHRIDINHYQNSNGAIPLQRQPWPLPQQTNPALKDGNVKSGTFPEENFLVRADDLTSNGIRSAKNTKNNFEISLHNQMSSDGLPNFKTKKSSNSGKVIGTEAMAMVPLPSKQSYLPKKTVNTFTGFPHWANAEVNDNTSDGNKRQEHNGYCTDVTPIVHRESATALALQGLVRSTASASSLERLTMINSPLHLDPIT